MDSNFATIRLPLCGLTDDMNGKQARNIPVPNRRWHHQNWYAVGEWNRVVNTNQNGNVQSVSYNSRLPAFSIPV